MFLSIREEHVNVTLTAVDAIFSPQRPSSYIQLRMLTQWCPAEGYARFRLPMRTVFRDIGTQPFATDFSLTTTNYKLLAKLTKHLVDTRICDHWNPESLRVPMNHLMYI